MNNEAEQITSEVLWPYLRYGIYCSALHLLLFGFKCEGNRFWSIWWSCRQSEVQTQRATIPRENPDEEPLDDIEDDATEQLEDSLQAFQQEGNYNALHLIISLNEKLALNVEYWVPLKNGWGGTRTSDKWVIEDIFFILFALPLLQPK